MKTLACFFVLSAISCYSQIAINEIQPYPSGDEPEWIELFVTSTQSVTTASLYIHDRTSRGVIPDTTFTPNSYVVLTRDTVSLKASRFVHPNAYLIQMSLPSLNNTTEPLFLMTKDSTILDSAYYDVKWGVRGKSLERIDVEIPARDKSNFQASESNDSATCGFQNSIARLQYDAKIQSITIDSLSKTLLITITNVGKEQISGTCTVTLDDKQITRKSLSLGVNKSDSLSVTFQDLFNSSTQGEFHRTLVQWNSENDRRAGNDSASITLYNSPPVESLLFNEIMFDPNINRSEFVEFINVSSIPISLQGWSLWDEASTKSSAFTIQDSIVVLPNGFALFAMDSSIFAEYPTLLGNKAVVVGSSSLSLNSSGELLRLVDPNGNVIDSVRYSPSWHVKDLPSTKGVSLEKSQPKLKSNQASAWSSSTSTSGATPLEGNSIAAELNPTSSLNASPNPFSPRDVGTKQQCVISFENSSIQSRVMARILDAQGIVVREIANTEFVGKTKTFIWNGKDSNEIDVPIGAYVCSIESVDIATQTTTIQNIVLVVGK